MPFFDHGAALLADTKMDYPLGDDTYALMETVKSKTISRSFDEQLEAADLICGIQLRLHFTNNDVDRILNEVPIYSEEEKLRVKTILFEQMRKYQYMFI